MTDVTVHVTPPSPVQVTVRRGPAGPAGPPGADGEAGPQGERGPAGADGAQGPAGADGSDGDPGPANVLSIGTVTTGDPGSSAAAVISGTSPAQVLSLTIPRGDPGADGAPGATYDHAGAGSPVGVITPTAAGEIYLDTAGTCGALRWISTGTTSSAWAVAWGDTGWREVRGQLVPGFTAASLQVRRVGQAIFWNAQNLAGSGGPALKLPLPAGFESVCYAVSSALNVAYSSGANLVKVAGGNVYFQIATITTATVPWPATLPGVPA